MEKIKSQGLACVDSEEKIIPPIISNTLPEEKATDTRVTTSEQDTEKQIKNKKYLHKQTKSLRKLSNPLYKVQNPRAKAL